MKMMWDVLTRLLRAPDDQQAVQSAILPDCLSQSQCWVLSGAPHESWDSPSSWAPDSTIASEAQRGKGNCPGHQQHPGPCHHRPQSSFLAPKKYTRQSGESNDKLGQRGSSSPLKYLMACRTATPSKNSVSPGCSAPPSSWK